MIGENLPDFAMVLLYRAAIGTRYAQVFQRETLCVEHPENVVVRDDEQFCWGSKLIVRIAEQTWIDMPVRAHQRQIPDLIVKFQRSGFIGRVEIAIFWQINCGHEIPPDLVNKNIVINDTVQIRTFPTIVPIHIW